MSNPKISVVLPVHNAEPFLGEAIESVLRQTFQDFELIVIDDGSVDNSAAVIKSFDDSRIRLIQNSCNKGLVNALNIGFQAASGKYIARMDADDICLPERFREQVSLLETEPAIGVCGTWFEYFGRWNWQNKSHPTAHPEIQQKLLSEGCVLAHPTVMMRKSVLDQSGAIYEEEFAHAEDYRLWTKLIGRCEFRNIGKVLLRYRVHSTQVTKARKIEQAKASLKVRSSVLATLVPEQFPQRRRLLEQIFSSQSLEDGADLKELAGVLRSALVAAKQDSRFSHSSVANAVARVWIGATSGRGIRCKSQFLSILPRAVWLKFSDRMRRAIFISRRLYAALGS